MIEEKKSDDVFIVKYEPAHDQVNPVKPVHREGMKGKERNKPCPCGSGKKYKTCCGKIEP